MPIQVSLMLQASQAASEGGLQDATTSDVSADFAEAKVAYEFELSQQWHLPEALGKKLLHMVSTVFEAACSALEAEHSALLEAEQEVARVLNSRFAAATLCACRTAAAVGPGRQLPCRWHVMHIL